MSLRDRFERQDGRVPSNWRRRDMIKSQLRKTANITAAAKSWEEARYDAPAGQAALAQADFALTYSGDLVGESLTRMLIAYTEGDPAEPASLVGEYVLERVTGT